MAGHLQDRRSSGVLPQTSRLPARVLIVDDHYTYRLLMSSLLEKLGVSYHCCHDGQQALRALATGHFDLVISDCRMPVMDGYTMTREWRRIEQAEGRAAMVVLGFTASLGPEEIRQCVACGMDGWLTKPVGLAQLREVLDCWLLPSGFVATSGQRAEPASARVGNVPSRASLIDTFGAWAVVEPMLLSLIREAHADLAVLIHAQVVLDAEMATQCLHRLVGSVAFLGEAGLEAGAVELIKRVHSTGVAINQPALDEFRHDVEWFLNYLARL